jgi:hypothetical protein
MILNRKIGHLRLIYWLLSQRAACLWPIHIPGNPAKID